MIEVRREGTKTLSLITDSTVSDVTISLRHGWGELILEDEATTEVSGTEHTYDLTAEDTASCGEIKVIWKYTESSTEKTKVEYIRVYVPYTTSLEFFEDYPELEAFEDNFAVVERRMRGVIEMYCGQEFNFHFNKTLLMDGTQSNTLHLPLRIETLTSVNRMGEEDMSEFVELAAESRFYIRRKTIYMPDRSEEFERAYHGDSYSPLFKRKYTYHILGDFGWPYVPNNVSEAAKILCAEWFNQDSEYRKHKITFQGTGPIQTRIDADFMGTTGNLDADVLLMDYTRFVLDWI